MSVGDVAELLAHLEGDLVGCALAEGEDWVHNILVGFASRVVKAAGGFGFITADVADSLTAQPIYELLLFTAHPDGLWEMANAMSFARQDWREYLVKQEEDKNQGQLVMRALACGRWPTKAPSLLRSRSRVRRGCAHASARAPSSPS